MVSLSVYNVGRQICTPAYQWGPGIRDHYLIHYIISGKGTYSTGGVTYELAAGDVFLVYPDTEVSYRADESAPWEYRWVGFAGSDASLILDHTDFRPDIPLIKDISFGEELCALLKDINGSFGNSFKNAVKMTGQLYLALNLLVANARTRTNAKAGDLTVINRAIDFIDSHYSYPISVEEIAAYAGVSRSTLFRQFRRAMDLSPKEYLMNFRLRRAKFLLRSTALPIGSVAVSVGFDNGLYFSKVFHAAEKMTPSEYRDQNK